MKEMDLLRAMNDIDEEYIAEAAPPVKEKKKRSVWVPMRYLVTAGVFAAVLMVSTAVMNLMDFRAGSASGGASESILATEEKAADDSVPAMAESDEAVNAAAADEEVAGTFRVPNTYGEYGSVTFSASQDSEEAVYLDEKGRAGLTLTRTPGRDRSEGLIEEMTVREGIMIREAGWCAGGYVYHAVFAEPVPVTEVLKLMEEVH